MSIQLKEITIAPTPATYAAEFFAAVSAANDPTKSYIYESAGANLSNVRSSAFHQGEKLGTHFRVVVLPTPTKQGFNLAVSINPKPIVRRNRKPAPAIPTSAEPVIEGPEQVIEPESESATSNVLDGFAQ